MALNKDYMLGMIELYKKAYNSQQLKDVHKLIKEKIDQYRYYELEAYKDKYQNATKEVIEKYKIRLDNKEVELDLEDLLESYEQPWPDDKYRPIWKSKNI